VQTHNPVDWRRTIHLPGELREPLTVLAKASERTVSGEIRAALREHIERAKSGKEKE
jgi:predicted DNA-binding protein